MEQTDMSYYLAKVSEKVNCEKKIEFTYFIIDFHSIFKFFDAIDVLNMFCNLVSQFFDGINFYMILSLVTNNFLQCCQS